MNVEVRHGHARTLSEVGEKEDAEMSVIMEGNVIQFSLNHNFS